MTAPAVRAVWAGSVAEVGRLVASLRPAAVVLVDVAECLSRLVQPLVYVAVVMAVVRRLATGVLVVAGPGAAGLVVGVTSTGVVGALLVWAERHRWWSR